MKKKNILLTFLLVFCLLGLPLYADDLGDLSGLSDNSASDLGGLSGSAGDNLSDLATPAKAKSDSGTPVITYGGYLKTLAYWNQEKYSDDLWSQYEAMKESGNPSPASQDLNGYNNVGTRMQLKVEGYLGDYARLFTAFNVNYNLASSLHDTSGSLSDSGKQNADIRMVESYVELYEGSRSWKIGSQIVTWSFLEGMEVPTDRVNARDHSYKSTEYEDSKIASTGILFTQNFGIDRLELMMIPVANVDVPSEFLDYFYLNDETPVENKANSSKWATRFVGTVGDLDYAVSYVEGLDPVADLNQKQVLVGTYMGQPVYKSIYGRQYHRIKSPGLDLQYNLGSWLAKMSWASYITEDEDGTDPLIKNNWSKYVAGAEFTVLGSTVNLYVGQTKVENYQDDDTSFLLGQIRERLDFVSGHFSADFLPGNALNLIVMAANYWDETGETMQTVLRSTVTYKIGNGLDVLFSPSHAEMLNNTFNDLQLEVKYSF